MKSHFKYFIPVYMKYTGIKYTQKYYQILIISFSKIQRFEYRISKIIISLH